MVVPTWGESDAVDDGEFVTSRSMTWSRTLRSRIRNTTDEPLVSNSSLLLLLLLTGDARDASDNVSVFKETDFSLTAGNSDTRNCDTLNTHTDTDIHTYTITQRLDTVLLFITFVIIDQLENLAIKLQQQLL